MGQICCPHCGKAVQIADGAIPAGQWGPAYPGAWWGTIPPTVPNPTVLQPTQFPLQAIPVNSSYPFNASVVPLVPGPGVTLHFDAARNTTQIEAPAPPAPLQGSEQEKPLATGGVIEPSNMPILVSEYHPEQELLTLPKGAQVWPQGTPTEPLEDPSA